MQQEHLLRHMPQNETKNEFSYCLNRKRTYNDCKIISTPDHQTRLTLIQNEFDALKRKYDKLNQEFADVQLKYSTLKEKYKSLIELDRNIDITVKRLMNNELNKNQYHKIMKSVLNKAKVSKSGRRKFETGTHIARGLICSVSNESKTTLPEPASMASHVRNLNEFISIKCSNTDLL